jgi:glycosyltransferase involved in cell wall biosynthesis
LNILMVTPTYYPAVAFGGPIFATLGLAEALAARADCRLRVLTTDAAGAMLSERVRHDANPATYAGGYTVHFSRRIAGVSIAPGLLVSLTSHLKWADVIYLNGTYSFPTLPVFLLCKFAGKPLVWSPCGAHLSALNWKDDRRGPLKVVWDGLCRLLAPQRCLVHVMSESEGRAVRHRIPGVVTELVTPGVVCPDDECIRARTQSEELRLVFLGRLDPIKGVDRLIRALSLTKEWWHSSRGLRLRREQLRAVPAGSGIGAWCCGPCALQRLAGCRATFVSFWQSRSPRPALVLGKFRVGRRRGTRSRRPCPCIDWDAVAAGRNSRLRPMGGERSSGSG